MKGPRFFFLRTVDGREVDLLVELSEGYLAFEIKQSDRALPTDARHLRDLGAPLDKPLLHSFVLSLDAETRTLYPGITALHGALLSIDSFLKSIYKGTLHFNPKGGLMPKCPQTGRT